ncbi:hypothetical protein [Paucilactobacillus hokkaidonensis]|uniref:hypothetical protein n=1 Tax=Paucilactobacillus hokkaidonensis TaxID=1193095 RepID=UPI000A9EE4FE|nr:hypothetical protein [Paucilactobacillus hokkaidonensis]
MFEDDSNLIGLTDIQVKKKHNPNLVSMKFNLNRSDFLVQPLKGYGNQQLGYWRLH